MQTYTGSCHCGDVKFHLRADFAETTTCNCSLCVKKNAQMVLAHEDQFFLDTDWSCLSMYQWNTRVAKHYFCKRCGIYTFHRTRSSPDHFGINIFCLDDFDESALPLRDSDGASLSVES